MSAVELITFTPELAEQYLSRTNIQRKIKPHIVRAYASDMLAGRWTLDATTIALDVDGNLVNGQHRLSAVVMSGCTITFAVMRGVSSDAILHMDSGTPRTTADQLHILDVPNSSQAAAISRAVLMYRGMPGHIWTGPTGKMHSTQAMQIEYIQQHRDLVQSAVLSSRGLEKLRFNKTAFGLLYILVNDDSRNADMWDDFADGIRTGAGLGQRDPRLALRNYFTRPDLKSWGGSQSHCLIVIRAWNKFVLDQDVVMFKVPRREELPMPKVQ